MVDIFISYAREDQEVVKRLAAALELQGWSVFWDLTIPAGGTWRSHIGNALTEARCVVVAWTADSIESHWVQEEADDARMRNVLIPVLLAPVSPPIGFRSIAAANLSGWNGNAEDELFLRFRTDVSRKLGDPPALIEERERQRVEEERKAAELLEKQHAEEKRKAAELLEKQRAEEKRKAAEQIEKQHSKATSQAEKPTAKKQPKTLRIARKRKPLLYTAIALSIITVVAWTAGVRLPQNGYELTVITTPPDASIEIQDVGRYTPGMQLEAGTYTIHAMSPGYQAEARVFEVAERDVELEMVLQAITYELVVISTPPDASIDIKDVGHYVPGMRLEAGSYTVRATLSGYQAEQKTVEITEHDTVLELQLQPTMYELTVLTSPPNASIEIQSVGQYTPGMRLEAGTYTIRATLPGYQPEERVFEVAERAVDLEFKLQPVDFKLQPATYELTVLTTPPSASIEVQNVGQYTPGMQLEAGTYMVRATSPGYQAEERILEIDRRDIELALKLRPTLPLPELVRIPAGTFMMGSEDGYSDEQPIRTVHIEQSFYLGKTEITFDEYDAFAEATGRNRPQDNGWGRSNRPVINVDWSDARAYSRWLDKLTGSDCRLPSEAEWEYAARAGTETKYALPAPEGGGDLSGYANCDDCGNSERVAMEYKEQIGKQTLPVASFLANAWGLHDMHGNVWEWVADCRHDSYKSAPNDGSTWLAESGGDCRSRVLRSGSWVDGQDLARSAIRLRNLPDLRNPFIGFRVFCSSPISDTDH